jgi:hypothetical protein
MSGQSVPRSTRPAPIRQRRTTGTAVATEILDKNLPRGRVEREG